MSLDKHHVHVEEFSKSFKGVEEFCKSFSTATLQVFPADPDALVTLTCSFTGVMFGAASLLQHTTDHIGYLIWAMTAWLQQHRLRQLPGA